MSFIVGIETRKAGDPMPRIRDELDLFGLNPEPADTDLDVDGLPWSWRLTAQKAERYLWD